MAMTPQPPSTASDAPQGMLLGLGNPLLDISICADLEFLQRYNLNPDDAILAKPNHDNMFNEMIQRYKPSYLPGGATQNSIRIAQWLLQKPKATCFIGAVGDDAFGRILKEVAQKVGVEVVYEVLPGADTGVCGAVITSQHRSLVSKLGAAKLLDLEFIRRPDVWIHIERASFFYIGGYVLPVCPAAIKSIVEHAADSNKAIAMNLHATYLIKDFVRDDLDLLPYIDVLFGNGDEAMKLGEEANMRTSDVSEIALKTSAWRKANSKRKRIVVITQGREPTIVAHDGVVEEHPVTPVDSALVKDTNGCGDAFAGGFLSQFVQGKPLADCLRCASYASRVVIQHYGCTYPERPDFH
ncbi:uncharacterized protein LOC135472370 [Liolophura sinensis]|uniref:uncharacterized protein LOC135472370 n=1 Tax=Liolophura sinensis TaxID=3198878 RepID=UPI0031591B15